MEYLEHYADLKGMQSFLAQETPFEREVRAAALFLAYDEFSKAGVSHCDFNPGNAMFNKDDPRDVKIIDFGLARLHDHPVGACRGNLEDIGSPGFLWMSLYRGQRDDIEFAQNNKKPGPWALGAMRPFETPSGKTLQPFSMMSGKFRRRGGSLPWNRETRDNWPGIVAYAKMLIREVDAARGGISSSNVHPGVPVVAPAAVRVEPAGARDEQPHANTSYITCKRIFIDRHGSCRLRLFDTNPCHVVIKCPYSGEVVSKQISQADVGFSGRIEIPNCGGCEQLE
jgi:serine/threonine protein kinase